VPLEDRVGAPPQQIIEYLHLGVILQGRSYQPRAAEPDPEFLNDVRRALSELPTELKGLLSTKVAGIFMVEDISGTAWSDQIFDTNEKGVAGMLALHQSRLVKQTANSWASWKESTPFIPHPHFRLTMQIASERENDRKNAIQYVLLHELGHIFSVGRNVHPSWNDAPKDIASPDGYPYFLLSWSISKAQNRYITRFDDNVFPQRKSIHYYDDEPKLSADQMVAVYDNLERTNLPTLYASERPAEDFAEAFATYVHTVLMKKPFLITISKDDSVVKTYKACWNEERCAEKREIIEKMLGLRD
jgi:predicted Zn-dependent protease with MMP-like domain